MVNASEGASAHREPGGGPRQGPLDLPFAHLAPLAHPPIPRQRQLGARYQECLDCGKQRDVPIGIGGVG